MKTCTISVNEKIVGVIISYKSSVSSGTTVHAAYKFDINGGLFEVGKSYDFEKAQSLIVNHPPLFDSNGECVEESHAFVLEVIANGFNIIRFNGIAVGFTIADSFKNENGKTYDVWEVYKYSKSNPVIIGKAYNEYEVYELVKNQNVLMDCRGKEI